MVGHGRLGVGRFVCARASGALAMWRGVGRFVCARASGTLAIWQGVRCLGVRASGRWAIWQGVRCFVCVWAGGALAIWQGVGLCVRASKWDVGRCGRVWGALRACGQVDAGRYGRAWGALRVDERVGRWAIWEGVGRFECVECTGQILYSDGYRKNRLMLKSPNRLLDLLCSLSKK